MRDYGRGLLSVIVVALQAGGLAAVNPSRVDPRPAGIRITSPLGRTGASGTIRIVAQAASDGPSLSGHARFFVDGRLLRDNVTGPPYAVDWIDENPFERCEIDVVVTDDRGIELRDRVVLEPFTIVDESQVTSVLLEASVVGPGGVFVKGLDQAAFSLLEDGTPQHLDMVRLEDAPATVALLVDSSASMSRRVDFVQRTAATLAASMRRMDRMLIVPFSRTLGPVTGPTNDRTTILEAIRGITPAGGTSILDAVAQVSRLFSPPDERRAVILMTDGYDEDSTIAFDDALAAARKARASVFVVGIGGVAGISLKGERLMRRLSGDTGGRVFFPTRETELSAVHDALAAELQNRYAISYTPTNQEADGRWRTLSLRTTNAQYAVRTRAGYFAPKPAPIQPTIEFTATGVDGEYLDLTADDLDIVEMGTAQHVESFQEAVQPVSIALVLDASGSMRGKEADVIGSAREFVAALRPEDQLAVLAFSDSSRLVHDFSTNRESTLRAIGDYRVQGGTALYDAVAEALQRLRSLDGRRALVVMTDGRDENGPGTAPGSVRKLPEVLQELKDAGTTFFGIGLGQHVDAAPLRQLADTSGGRAFFPADPAGLHMPFRRVVEDLRRRYVVRYTSSHPQRDGGWRTVDIHVRSRADAHVRSLGGYQAPGSR